MLRIWFVVSLRTLKQPPRLRGGVAEDVTHGAVGTLPHLLQFEFLYPGLVWGDGSAFDSDVVLLDGLRRVDRDLVVGLRGNDVRPWKREKRRGTYGVSGLESEVVVLDVEVEIRKDELQ